jgi:hypothetical protein
MLEALCEACRLNPAMQDEPSDDFKRANPNWWYRRRKVGQPYFGADPGSHRR